MKILLVHEVFPPTFRGGGEKLAYDIAKALKEKHEIEVLTTGNPKIKSFKGIRTIRINLNRFFLFFAIKKIIKHAKDKDLIITTTYHSALPCFIAAKLLKKPIILVVFSLFGDAWKKMRHFPINLIAMLFEKFIIRRNYDKILFLSNFSKQLGLSLGVKKEKTFLLTPALDLKNYKAKKKQDFVLFSGRFSKQKGIYDVIKVAKKLKDIKFVMMGWGKEERKLKKIAPKNVEFSSLRLKNGKPFFDTYSKARIFFLPSYAETFGFTIVEAMASGCAIVSTIPLNYKGFLVGKGNIEQMAKAINYLMKNKDKAEKFGKRNIKLAKKYNLKNFKKSLFKAINEIKIH